MDFTLTISGTCPDEDELHPDEARDHDIANATRDLLAHLTGLGCKVERASFGAGHIRGGSVDLLVVE